MEGVMSKESEINEDDDLPVHQDLSLDELEEEKSHLIEENESSVPCLRNGEPIIHAV
jgi:hypothetical protein